MLVRLSIKNYALIDKIDIQFGEGLNIITGETGAGKSIILGALSLILGQRSESKHFYNQDKKCVIEGFFAIEDYGIQDFFEAHDLDYESQTIIRREIYPDGKSRAFVNDTPVKLNLLKALSEKLIAIHSQHATLEINAQSFQLLTIDSVADNSALLKNFDATFRRFLEVDKEFDLVSKENAQLQSEMDYHQFLFDELQAADLKIGEQKSLENEQSLISHSEEIKQNLQQANYLLEEQEQSGLSLIKQSLQQLQQAEQYFPKIEELSNRLNSSLIELKDISNEISLLNGETSVDSERMQLIEDRLSLIYKLQQKHQVDDVASLLNLKDELDTKINAVLLNDDRLIKLTEERKYLHEKSRELAQKLTKSRQAVISKIEDSIQHSLKEVGMPHSIFKIRLTVLDNDKLKKSGQDEIEFLFSANQGQKPQAVSKVASGGELSRLMLAIKSLAARTSALPTIIFDEIDTGISGDVAIKVGELMRRLTENLQVIAITHLPQIASQGTQHFKVFKEQLDDRTLTNIRLLEQEQRVEELAQMLGGKDSSETAVLHARELLSLYHKN